MTTVYQCETELSLVLVLCQVLLTVRDPVRWYQSVNNTIRQIVRFMTESWLAAPLRLASRLTGKGIAAAKFTCFAPTHLGPRYPLGMFGAVDAGQETAVRFFNEWRDQVGRTPGLVLV